MPSMVECKCANKSCGVKFMARTADRARGWGRFCSKSCKAIKQDRRTGQYADHKHHQHIRDMNGGKSAGDLQRGFGGIPAFDRHGRYEGFTLGGEGFDNTAHQNHDEND